MSTGISHLQPGNGVENSSLASMPGQFYIVNDKSTLFIFSEYTVHEGNSLHQVCPFIILSIYRVGKKGTSNPVTTYRHYCQFSANPEVFHASESSRRSSLFVLYRQYYQLTGLRVILILSDEDEVFTNFYRSILQVFAMPKWLVI